VHREVSISQKWLACDIEQVDRFWEPDRSGGSGGEPGRCCASDGAERVVWLAGDVGDTSLLNRVKSTTQGLVRNRESRTATAGRPRGHEGSRGPAGELEL